MEKLNVKCPYCKTPVNDIFTHCPFCAGDTGGEALCISCNKPVQQIVYWAHGKRCPRCKPSPVGITSGPKELFEFSEDFSSTNYTKKWAQRSWFLRGQTSLGDSHYIIRNRYGWKWDLSYPVGRLDLDQSFLIKSEIEILEKSTGGYFGLSFSGGWKTYQFLHNGSDQFMVQRNFKRGKYKVSVGGSVLFPLTDWTTIPMKNLGGSSSVLLEVLYNRERETFNFYFNGEKIAFSPAEPLPCKRPTVGFVTGGKGITIGVRALLARNLGAGYIH